MNLSGYSFITLQCFNIENRNFYQYEWSVIKNFQLKIKYIKLFIKLLISPIVKSKTKSST